MPLQQIKAPHANTELCRLLEFKATEYAAKYPASFIGLALFGSQAKGTWTDPTQKELEQEIGTDVDVGLIYRNWVELRADDIAHDLDDFLRQNNYRLCSRLRPGSADFYLDEALDTQVSRLQFYCHSIAPVLHVILTWKKTELPRNVSDDLIELYPYCLPFGLCFGDQEKIAWAGEQVNYIISRTPDPKMVEAQLAKILDFMYLPLTTLEVLKFYNRLLVS
jgi:hypothetical protein